MQQQPLSLEQQAQEKAAYRAIFAKRQTSNGGFDADRMEISALDVDAVERTATFERLWRAGGLRFWYNNFSDLLTDERANRFAYRSEEHTSELQSLMRISYAVFCLKKKTDTSTTTQTRPTSHRTIT